MRYLLTLVFLLLSVVSQAQTFFSKVYHQPQPRPFAPISTGIGCPIVRTSDAGYLLTYAYYPQTLESYTSALTQIVRTDSLLVPKWRLEFAGMNPQTIPLANGACVVWGTQVGATLAQKVDSAGNIVWSKYIMWDNPDGFFAESAVYTGSKIRFAGFTFEFGLPFFSQTTPMFIDIDTSGNVMGGQNLSFLGLSTTLLSFTGISMDGAGNYIFTGDIGGPKFIVKMSSSDVVLWSKELNTTYAVPQLTNSFTLNSGGIVIAGKYYDTTVGGYVPMIGKLSSTGGLMWAKTIDTTFGYKFNLQELPSGNILASTGPHLMEIDTMGNLIWSRHFGGKINVLSPAYFKAANDWYFTAITKDSFSLVVFNTDSTGLGHCPPTNDVFVLNNASLLLNNIIGILSPTTFHTIIPVPDTAVLQPYSDTCAGYIFYIPPTKIDPQISKQKSGIELFPNPATNEINIKAETQINSVMVYNLTGTVVLAQQCNANEVKMNISRLTPGMYYVKINGIGVRKFIKE